jgi:hypothetical protein
MHHHQHQAETLTQQQHRLESKRHLHTKRQLPKLSLLMGVLLVQVERLIRGGRLYLLIFGNSHSRADSCNVFG